MTSFLRLTLIMAGLLAAPARAEEPDPIATEAHRIQPNDPAWGILALAIRQQGPVTASFTERRWFSIRKAPVVLRGEARLSDERGLSLHYLDARQPTVIIDNAGVILRPAAGQAAQPMDPRAAAGQLALLRGLRLDFDSLGGAFDIYGRHSGLAWTVTLVPRAAGLRRALGRITVEGRGPAVRRIELRRSAAQRVEISVDPPRPAAAFTPDELRRYFR
jgi:hypothetical protein